MKQQRSPRTLVFAALVLIALAGCADLIRDQNYYLSQSDDTLWDQSIAGRTGHCRIVDARADKTTLCRYYLKIDGAKWAGGGWPVDPVNKAGDGCIGQRSVTQDYLGPSPWEYKAAIQSLRSAIADPANPCVIMKSDLFTSTLN